MTVLTVINTHKRSGLSAGSGRDHGVSSSEPAPLWELPEPSRSEPEPKASSSRAVKPKAKAAGKPGAKKSGPRKGQQLPAPELPVAKIVVDIPLAHLDRTFDYQVPDKLHEAAVPGCRVRVRFAGQLVDG